MPRVLIAGCGYVGRATAKVFQSAGWEVEGWTSSIESARELSAESFVVRAVDLTTAAAVAEAASAMDVVIHCASSGGGGVEDYRQIYLEGVRHLASTFPRLLIFTSSTSVYAQTSGEWVSEESPAEPQRATGRILREAEGFVLAYGGVVARLAGIYGPGRSALLRKFLAGEATIDQGGERFVNQVHRDDIAEALLLLAQQGLAKQLPEPRIYNVTDDHPISQRECVEWLAARLQRAIPPVSTTPAERKRGNSNKRVSSAKLQALGWSPRYPTFQVAMNESILPALTF